MYSVVRGERLGGRGGGRGGGGGVKGPIHLEMLACSIHLGSRKFAFNYFLKVGSVFLKSTTFVR